MKNKHFQCVQGISNQQPLLVVQVTTSLLPAGEDNTRLLSANLASFASLLLRKATFLSKLMRSLASFFFTKSSFRVKPGSQIVQKIRS